MVGRLCLILFLIYFQSVFSQSEKKLFRAVKHFDVDGITLLIEQKQIKDAYLVSLTKSYLEYLVSGEKAKNLDQEETYQTPERIWLFVQYQKLIREPYSSKTHEVLLNEISKNRQCCFKK